MGLHKILKIIVAIIGIAALIVAGMVWANNKAIEGGESQNLVDIMILLAWIVIGIAILLVAVFVLKGLFTGNAKNTLIGVGAFLVVMAIAYFVAPSEVPQGVMAAAKDDVVLTPQKIQLIGAGINAFFILAAIAILLMLVSGAKKLVNR